MPSKFISDNRLHRQIARDSENALQTIHDKLDYINRKTNTNPNNRPSTSTSTHIRFGASQNRQKESKDVYIELSDSSDEESADSTEQNIEDLIDMMAKGDELEYLSDESDQSNNNSSDDKDSKCLQYGKYSKKKNQTIKTKTSSLDNKLTTRLRKNKHTTTSNSDMSSGFSKARDNTNRLDDAIENLEQKYKSIRNERNKLLRRKKGIEINAQRQIMSDELKVIRREMKKLRQRKRKDFYKTNSNNSNNLDFIPLNGGVDAKSKQPFTKKKNSKKKNFRRKNSNKIKTNRAF